MTTEYDLIVIGFGKAGKMLAKTEANLGKKVLLVEKDSTMYGGTCINVGCLPSKAMIYGGDEGKTFEEAMKFKRNMVTRNRGKNYHKLADDPNIDVWDGVASFVNNDELTVKLTNGEVKNVKAQNVVINTGALPVIPEIDGIDMSVKGMLTSKDALDLDYRPDKLTIIGGGYVGLEFAGMFAKYGTDVTVLDKSDVFLRREDRDVADYIYETLTAQGIDILRQVDITRIIPKDHDITIEYHDRDGNMHQLASDHVLVAAGRKPNIADLHLENTDIEVNSRDGIVVNEYLETTVKNIYAAGDVTGKLMFNYISQDDFRIIRDKLAGKTDRTTNNRSTFFTTTFLTPPLAQVGLTEAAAKTQGLNYQVFKVHLNDIPGGNVLDEEVGLIKAVVDKDTSQILGMTLFCPRAQEVVNTVALAMDNKMTYQELAGRMYVHPSISEFFNVIFA